MDTTTGLGGVLGLIIAIIFFVIGIVWLIFPFIVNSWLKKIHSEVADGTLETRSLIQEIVKTNQHLARIAEHTKKTTTPITRKTAPIAIPEPSSSAQTLTISKNGQNIGEHTFSNVKQMLKSKQLTLQDMYFDTATQEWTALDLHPSLY